MENIEAADEDTFYIDIPVDSVELIEKSEGEGKRCIKGYASTEDLDKDGESILQKGMDFGPLMREGYINYDHQKQTIGGAKFPIIIGIPTLVELRKSGLWVEGELFKGDSNESEQIKLANEMWQLGLQLKKSGTRKLAYSIEGSYVQRRGKKVVKSIARNVALTHKPVNAKCSVEMFAKSLCCGGCTPGSSNYNPSRKCGNKADAPTDIDFLTKGMEKAMSTATTGALMLENLDRGMSKVLYGDKQCDCYDGKTGCFHKGIQGAAKHMTDCTGCSSDDTFKFLKKIIHGSGKNPDFYAFAKTAGLISS
jgi:hypothetical protein